MTTFLFFIFVAWLIKGIDLFFGLLKTRSLELQPFDLSKVKKISIIFAARNEARAISKAVSSMLTSDYPDFEVIAVNDRSEDETLCILEKISKDYPDRLKVLNVEKLSAGWLGKNHALFEGYKVASGEWLLFTDADVLFKPETLRAAFSFVEAEELDHLALFPKLIIKKYVEACFTNYFALIFNMRFRPWSAQNPKSKAYVGIGAFNLICRKAYERIGTHQALALEVADDMMLGKLVKENNFRQAGLLGTNFLSVRWVEGLSGVLQSLRKNAYRGLNYNPFLLILATIALICADLVPFVGLFLFSGLKFQICLATILVIVSLYAAGQRYNKTSLLACPMHPLTSFLYVLIFWLSALDVIRFGGIRWRNTIYSLKDLPRVSL